MTRNDTQRHRRPSLQPGRKIQARLSPLAASSIVALLLGLPIGSPAHAQDPLRLHLVRATTDTEAQGAACMRGRLYVVRAFDEEALARGVWVADTLEPLATFEPSGSREPAEAIAAGIHTAAADDAATTGWQIELGAGKVLRAHPEGRAAETAGAILMGRRPAAAGTGPCDLERERLADGAALARRLRDIQAAPAGGRPIEILIEP